MKTNRGLVEYAKAQVGRPYWYGTYGQTASQSLYNSKKAQYPKYYTASDFASQYGRRVHDCVGLIKGYIWSDGSDGTPKYNSSQDKNATGMYKASAVKGPISQLPQKAGMLVYKGTPSRMSHVGVYDGEGYVYEAKGHAYGVVKTAFNASDWQYYSQCPYTEDDSASSGQAQPEDNTNAGGNTQTSSGDEVIRDIQSAIDIRYGCSIAHDGIYGPKTKKALVTGFQTELNTQYNKGLTVDGIWGPKTKAACITVRKNARGNITYILQSALYCNGFNPGEIDGIFGDNTLSAVKSFQSAKGISVDGAAGKNTFEKLLG